MSKATTSARCECEHAKQLHGPSGCGVYLGKGAIGADRKGFCKCQKYREAK